MKNVTLYSSIFLNIYFTTDSVSFGILIMLKAIKLITFDAMDTLFTTKCHPAVTYFLAATTLYPKLEKDSERIKDSLKQNFKSVFSKHYTNYTEKGKSRDTCKEFWHNVIGETLNDSGAALRDNEMREVTDKLYTDFETTLNWRAFSEVDDTLKKLQSMNIRLGVVSNFDERLDKVLINLDLKKYFEFVVYPPVTNGIGKPDIRIYKYMMEKFSNCLPNEILHIGDSLELDYNAATKVGINGLLLNRSHNMEGKGYNTISSLSDLIVD